MILFFLLLAACIPAQAQNISCPLRPFDTDKRRYMMCIPTKSGNFEIGDFLQFSGINGTQPWSVNFVSSSYEILFHINIRPGQKKFVLNRKTGGPFMMAGKWQKEQVESFNGTVDKDFRLKITNTAKNIQIEVTEKAGAAAKTFNFAHRTTAPATDYKNVFIVKEPAMKIDRIEFRSHLTAAKENNTVIQSKEDQWKLTYI